MILRSVSGAHSFVIPNDYKYARLKIDLYNLDSEDVEELKSYPSIINKEGFIRILPEFDAFTLGIYKRILKITNIQLQGFIKYTNRLILCDDGIIGVVSPSFNSIIIENQ